MKKCVGLILVLGLVLLGTTTLFAAEKYFTRHLTVIVPFGAGGATDTTARIFTEALKDPVGQPLMVSNQKGAGGYIGVSHFLKLKPDGYNLLITDSGTLTDPALKGKEPFDMEKFQFIGGYMAQARILVANGDAPFDDWDGFVDYAKKNPGKISFGAGGAQWGADVFQSLMLQAGFDSTVVVFDSGGEAASNVMGGHVTLVECGVGSPAYMAAKAGKTKIILNLSPGRVPGFPDVPNVEEKGYQFEEINVYGIFTHAEAPKEAVAELAATFKSVFEEKSTQEKLQKLGIDPEYFSSENFRNLCVKAGQSVNGLGEYLKKAKAEGRLK